MNAVKFKDQNYELGKPKGMTEEECLSLPVKITMSDCTGKNFPAIESVWELTDEEIEMIKQTKRIRLGVLGGSHPPVYLTVEPFDNCAVNMDWQIMSSPSDISQVMKAEDCRFIGTFVECKDFIKEHAPKETPAPAQQ